MQIVIFYDVLKYKNVRYVWSYDVHLNLFQ